MSGIPTPMPYPGHNGWPPDGCGSVLTKWLEGAASIRRGFRDDAEAMRFAEHEAGRPLVWTWDTNEGGNTYGYADDYQISDPWST